MRSQLLTRIYTFRKTGERNGIHPYTSPACARNRSNCVIREVAAAHVRPCDPLAAARHLIVLSCSQSGTKAEKCSQEGRCCARERKANRVSEAPFHGMS